MSDQSKCPVDHSTREAWLKNTAGEGADAKTELPPNHPAPTSESSACPVDHKSQQIWLQKHVKSQNSEKQNVVTEDIECSSDQLPETPQYTSSVKLPIEREVSSIPRTGSDANWVYPSEKQFFEAMKRKNWDPNAIDMKTVVPIHNSVNERAWNYIKLWEAGKGGDSCGGIKLTSFKGDSKKLTPRAWLRSSILGYSKPFDRHDWIVDRCGKEVGYVIDFYSNDDPANSTLPEIYLDVRPKLNTIEGIKLRVMKALGW